MFRRPLSFTLLTASFISFPTFGEDFAEIEAQGGRAVVHLDTQAKVGEAVYCEFDIRDIHYGPQWIPLIAINLDEGGVTDQDSKYLQLDMQFLADEDQTIMHALSNGGFTESFEEPFLLHWQQANWYSLYFFWESDGVFRYHANVGGGVVGTGVFSEPDFNPKFFRVSVSGLKVGIECEIE